MPQKLRTGNAAKLRASRKVLLKRWEGHLAGCSGCWAAVYGVAGLPELAWVPPEDPALLAAGRQL